MEVRGMLISPILVTHTLRATITKNTETTFTSTSRFHVEKKKSIK